MQVVLNKNEKEQLVIKLHQEGKPIREIAQQAHLSFGTIAKIIKQINRSENSEVESNDMRRDLASIVLDLEIRKKELNAQLIDLVQLINQYQNAVDIKKEQLMEMDKQQLLINKQSRT